MFAAVLLLVDLVDDQIFSEEIPQTLPTELDLNSSSEIENI